MKINRFPAEHKLPAANILNEVKKVKKQTVATGKTVEAAVAAGAEALGVSQEAVSYEIVEQPKKGFLGVGAAPAKVKVEYVLKPEEAAMEFLQNLIKEMEVEATVTLREESNGEKLLSVSGEKAGVFIGHHGDTLDALQYLVNLAANRKDEDDRTYTRFTLDVENYRAKREETLRQLARRMASKALKYRKNITLEPMTPYERRIIHSEIQNIEGVSTNSIGTENNRKIVIYLTASGTKEEKAEAPAKPERQEKAKPERSEQRTERPRSAKSRQPESSSREKEKNEQPVSSAKPYYMRPVRKPVKEKSVASYFGDEEYTDDYMEEPLPENIAEICGIYEGDGKSDENGKK